MIKAIIFDFDGVIVESFDIKTTAFTRLFEAEGAEAVARIVDFHLASGGVSRFDKFHHIYREFLHRELPADEFERLCREFSGLVLEEVVAAPFVPGALAFLERYHSRIPCYVASATPQDELATIVERRKLDRFFRGVCGAPRKKSEIISSILAELAIRPDEALFVGDALNDYRAAETCGVPFVGREPEGSTLFAGIGCSTVHDLTTLAPLLGLEQ